MIESKIKMDKAHELLVRSLVKTMLPQNPVWAFGSRVHGTPKPHSDLDLVIIDPPVVPPEKLALLKLDLEESDLPFRVDVLIWSELNVEFKNIIKKNDIEF